MKKAEVWTYNFTEVNMTAYAITDLRWWDAVPENSTYGKNCLSL